MPRIVCVDARVVSRWLATFALLVAAGAGAWSLCDTGRHTLRAAEPVDFGREVLPILSGHCFACHGPDAKTRKGDLQLDTRDAALRATDPVIQPGDAKSSELFKRLTSTDPAERMPPASTNRPLTPKQIDTLRRWIDEGAAWGKHWAYVAPRRPALPTLPNEFPAPRNAIDHFVFARLAQESLRPSAEAGKETLLRRVALDLTGLPPTPEEVTAFLADARPNAYELAVDRLLASPHYGERMAWDWLDAARYADTDGYQGDPERTMWPWRDWVVKALNDNLPYNQFTIEQLAGDLLPQPTFSQRLATGFHRNHMHNAEGGRIPEETRVENVMDRLETTATVWMGTTLGCARCHDHKFDPFTQREYYQLYAFFNNMSENGGGRSGQRAPTIDVLGDDEVAQLEARRQKVRDQAKAVTALEAELFPDLMKKGDPTEELAKLPKPILDELRRPAEQRAAAKLKELIAHFTKPQPAYTKALQELDRAVAERDRVSNAVPRVMVMDELPKPRDTFMLVRGAYNKPGDAVTVGVPTALPPLRETGPVNRLAMAQWLVNAEHPLTARVTVNRYWQTFFGTGLVKTVEDFGRQGEQPSHPELLDWLATEFTQTGWDVKRMHRLIVTSGTYRQASPVSRALQERDPENRLLARGPRFRMPSWMIRDQALAASGLLVPKLGGASVKPYQPVGVWEEATFGKKTYVQDKGENLYRRSLYTFWRRIVGPTAFFDAGSRQVCTVKSVRTNTPLHALATLNDITYVEAARALAQRVLEKTASTEGRIDAAMQWACGRPATREEQQILSRAVERLRPLYAADEPAALRLLKVGESPRNESLDPRDHATWTAICSLILNLDETLTKQ